jgi:allantoinase
VPLTGYTSSRVVFDDRVARATVLIENGVIQAVEPGPVSLPGVIDVGERLISPGLVDCHVHINEPGRTEWEGFQSATRAAAAGGVTALVDMPLNSIPVTTTGEALDIKLAACAGQCCVDVGFWGGVIPGNAASLRPLAEGGVLGCKAFLVHSGIDEFPNTTEADLRAAMPILRDLGLPLLAHAELDLGAAPSAESAQSYQGYLDSRPKAWEDAAIQLLVKLCRDTGCAVHIVHLSSSTALGTLRAAKDAGLPITVETCPHYLCLESETIPDGATHFKCAPPIREHSNREALWAGLFEGVIDFVITDHSPCLPALKELERGDFHAAWGGIASLQLGLPTLWSEAKRRGATPVELARWMSERPARFAGLGRKKGRIARGFDADLTIWEPEATFSVKEEHLFFRHKLSPYLGMGLSGRVCETVLRGQRIFDGQAHLGSPLGVPMLYRGAAA